MAVWTITALHRSEGESYLVSRRGADGKNKYYGERIGDIHVAVLDIKDNLEQGDILQTPEGVGIFQKTYGEPRN